MGATVGGAGGMHAGGGAGARAGGALRWQPALLLPSRPHVLHRRAITQVSRYVETVLNAIKIVYLPVSRYLLQCPNT